MSSYRFNFIIVDSEIEVVPRQLWNESAVKKDAKRRRRHPSRILLFTPIHYTAMIKHGIDVDRRGRPDITQDILKTILNHPIKDYVDMSVLVQTLNNIVFRVNPDTRIPHFYYKFEGLMIELLKHGMVPKKDGRFMRVVEPGLERHLIGDVYILDEKGVEFTQLFKKPPEKATFIIGGFQRGGFKEEIYRLGTRVSIYRKPLYSATATCILLTNLWNLIKSKEVEA